MARLSSRFSRSSSRTRSRSPDFGPVRSPVSRSAWRTQRRSVSDVQPTFSESEQIAPHWESWSFSCSKTIRTARSLSAKEYLFPLFMTPTSQTLGPPANPVRFTFTLARKSP